MLNSTDKALGALLLTYRMKQGNSIFHSEEAGWEELKAEIMEINKQTSLLNEISSGQLNRNVSEDMVKAAIELLELTASMSATAIRLLDTIDDFPEVEGELPVEVLRLPSKTTCCLRRRRIKTISDLNAYESVNDLNTRNLGDASRQELQGAMDLLHEICCF